MTSAISFSFSETEPFVNINKALEIFRSFSKTEKTHRVAIKQILDLRDILHVRDNLSSVVLRTNGKKLGEILLSLSAKTIQALQLISIRFFEQYYQIADSNEVIRDTIPLFLDQVEAYAQAEKNLGLDPTWLRTFTQARAPTDEASLSMIASVYDRLNQ